LLRRDPFDPFKNYLIFILTYLHVRCSQLLTINSRHIIFAMYLYTGFTVKILIKTIWELIDNSASVLLFYFFPHDLHPPADLFWLHRDNISPAR